MEANNSAAGAASQTPEAEGNAASTMTAGQAHAVMKRNMFEVVMAKVKAAAKAATGWFRSTTIGGSVMAGSVTALGAFAPIFGGLTIATVAMAAGGALVGWHLLPQSAKDTIKTVLAAPIKTVASLAREGLRYALNGAAALWSWITKKKDAAALGNEWNAKLDELVEKAKVFFTAGSNGMSAHTGRVLPYAAAFGAVSTVSAVTGGAGVVASVATGVTSGLVFVGAAVPVVVIGGFLAALGLFSVSKLTGSAGDKLADTAMAAA